MNAWPEVALGDLCHIARGGSPRPIKSFLTSEPDGINWIKIGDASAGDGKYISSTQEKIRPAGLKMSRLVEPGDFLLSNSMSFGRPYIMRTTGCIHDGWLVLKDKSRRFDPNYLYYFLGSDATYRQFDALAAGSTVRNLNTDLVKTVKVILPSIEEQRRIVAILDGAFAAIVTAAANAEKNLANARELFVGAVTQAFGDDSLPSRPLGEVAEVIMGQSPPGTTYNTAAIGTPLINGPDEFGGRDAFARTLATKFTTHPTKMCREGDAIVCVRGSTTGRMNLAGQDACIGRGVAAVRSETDQGWINQFLRFNQEVIYRLGSGATFPNVSTSHLKNLKIPLPPLTERARLLEKLQAVDSITKQLIVGAEQKLRLLDELKQSLLHRAFSGELTERELLAA